MIRGNGRRLYDKIRQLRQLPTVPDKVLNQRRGAIGNATSTIQSGTISRGKRQPYEVAAIALGLQDTKTKKRSIKSAERFLKNDPAFALPKRYLEILSALDLGLPDFEAWCEGPGLAFTFKSTSQYPTVRFSLLNASARDLEVFALRVRVVSAQPMPRKKTGTHKDIVTPTTITYTHEVTREHDGQLVFGDEQVCMLPPDALEPFVLHVDTGNTAALLELQAECTSAAAPNPVLKRASHMIAVHPPTPRAEGAVEFISPGFARRTLAEGKMPRLFQGIDFAEDYARKLWIGALDTVCPPDYAEEREQIWSLLGPAP